MTLHGDIARGTPDPVNAARLRALHRYLTNTAAFERKHGSQSHALDLESYAIAVASVVDVHPGWEGRALLARVTA